MQSKLAPAYLAHSQWKRNLHRTVSTKESLRRIFVTSNVHRQHFRSSTFNSSVSQSVIFWPNMDIDSRTSAGGSDCPSCVKHWCGVKWGYVWATRPPLLLLLLPLWRQWTLCVHSQSSLGTSQITATTKTERFITDTSDVIVLVADRFRNHGTNSRLALPVARHSLYRLTTI